MAHVIRALLAAAVLSSPTLAGAVDKLPALAADPARTSVSGLSSGAFMSVQYHVAFSSSTIGAGVVAGGPYKCAYVNVGGILTCMQGIPVGSTSNDVARNLAALGKIDAVDNLAKSKVYLFSGTADTVVKQTAMDAVRDFYTLAAVPAANLVYVNNFAAGHAFISPSFGNLCATTASPFVNECDAGTDANYDQPGAILTHIYGPLAAKVPAPSENLVAFDQTEFTSSVAGMAATGYLYTPTSCQKAKGKNCVVHVVFHGCQQGAGEVGNAVYSKTGYNQWAESNGIVVLYPQLDPTDFPLNPQGCWDWWGYSGLDFATRSGAQLSAVHVMVQRLTGL